jgi:anti-sigma B factor antagonist
MGLTIDQTENDSKIRISVRGEVDLYTSPDLRAAIMKSVPSAVAGVEVELAGVEYMDSSGVATLVEGFKSARKNSKTFVLLKPSPSVMKVLELARLDAVFEIDRTP